MKTFPLSRFPWCAVLACALACLPPSARAQLAYRVSMNTSALVGHAAGPFLLDFQLNDGEGAGNGNNTAWLANFDFGGGGAAGAATTWGGASGDLWTGVTIVDTEAFNEFYQPFTAGAWLSFDLRLTTKLNEGLVPDLFSFAILDSTLANLPTLSGGSDALLEINIDEAMPGVAAFGADGSIEPNAGGPGILLGAPSFRPIPEPSTYGIVGAALLGIAVGWRRLRALRR